MPQRSVTLELNEPDAEHTVIAESQGIRISRREEDRPRLDGVKIAFRDTGQPGASFSRRLRARRVRQIAGRTQVKGPRRILREAVESVKRDWRDLWMAARFGRVVRAHATESTIHPTSADVDTERGAQGDGGGGLGSSERAEEFD